MKRLWISLLSLLLVFSIVGCDSNQTVEMKKNSMEEMGTQTVTEESQSESSEGIKNVESVENENSISYIFLGGVIQIIRMMWMQQLLPAL